MFETFHEEVIPLLLHALKIHLSLLGFSTHVVKILVSLGKLLPCLIKFLHGLHIWSLKKERIVFNVIACSQSNLNPVNCG